MDFSDRILLQLATSDGRNALLGQLALGTMVAAAFDTAASPVDGPYALEIDNADLGLEIARTMVLEGAYTAVPGAVPGALRLRTSNGSSGDPLRIEALWRGALIARQIPQDDRIAAIAGGFTLLDLDREIIGALGALPAGAALVTERRQRLLARLKTGAAQAGAIDDAVLDAMLAAGGVTDVGALLAERGTADLARFRLTFTAPAADVPAVPIRLPVSIAVLLREAPQGLAALLAESRAIRSALAEDPTVQPVAAPLRRRVPVLVVWIVPATVFDDNDWPGADRADRITTATDLFSGQGIALATA